MKIKKIKLSNFRKYTSLDIDFPLSNFIVLIGKNGVGKSSILDSIAYGLSHITGQLCSATDSYSNEYCINRKDIKNGKAASSLDLLIELNALEVGINCSRAIDQNGHSYNISPDNIISDLKDNLRTNFSVNLPLMIYYRINRTSSIANKMKNIEPYYNKILEGYRYSFSSNLSGFNRFEDWFISEENIENQQKVANQSWTYEKPNLKILRIALTQFLSKMDDSNYSDLRVERKSEDNLVYDAKHSVGNVVVNKDNTTVRLSQLSSGEKMVILLVSDIARRLLILNGSNDSSLLGQGIVLIDELEMHLHPNWQRNIVESLKTIFPNIQFITSTHSPQIVSNLSSRNILELDSEDSVSSINMQTYGVDSNSLLEHVFESTYRPTIFENLINEFYDLMDNNANVSEVNSKLEEIKNLKESDNGQLSDTLIDDLVLNFYSYKIDKNNDSNK